jgi:hypothetical protein
MVQMSQIDAGGMVEWRSVIIRPVTRGKSLNLSTAGMRTDLHRE